MKKRLPRDNDSKEMRRAFGLAACLLLAAGLFCLSRNEGDKGNVRRSNGQSIVADASMANPQAKARRSQKDRDRILRIIKKFKESVPQVFDEERCRYDMGKVEKPRVLFTAEMLTRKDEVLMLPSGQSGKAEVASIGNNGITVRFVGGRNAGEAATIRAREPFIILRATSQYSKSMPFLLTESAENHIALLSPSCEWDVIFRSATCKENFRYWKRCFQDDQEKTMDIEWKDSQEIGRQIRKIFDYKEPEGDDGTHL